MTTPSAYHLGILGYPLGHSLSGVFQPLYLEQAGLTGDYTPLEIAPEDLDDWVQAEKAVPRLNGFNVTIPHKVRVLEYLDSLSDEARLIGAVNTVCITETGWHGHNTDAFGFMAPLTPERRQTLREARVLIIGAGGASRAVAYGLLQGAPRQITFLVRSLERAEETTAIASRMNQAVTGGKTVIEWTCNLSSQILAEATWVINTSPAGMSPNSDTTPLEEALLNRLSPTALVYDLVYNPLETKLLKMARKHKLATQDGLDMLLYQGSRSFNLWTGATLPDQAIDAARQAVLSALRFRP